MSDKMRRAPGYNYSPLGQQDPGTADNHLEAENERLAEELKGKIGALKTLTIDIGNEVRYQDKMLSGMDDDMDRTGSLLKNTMNRVIRLGKTGHRGHMCYMVAFVFGVLFLLYLIVR